MPHKTYALEESSEAEKAQITPKIPLGIALLRSKQIKSISFNNPNHEIIIFTKRSPPKSKKQIALLPDHVDDVTVKYRQGVQELGTLPSGPQAGPTYLVRAAAGADRYTCGSSISVGNFRDAGTLGCLVRDAAGVLYGLTNNHVSGGCNFAGVGLPIVAPGIFDVAAHGLNPFTLGLHARALTMVPGSVDNIDHTLNFDAALFNIVDETRVTSFQRDHRDSPQNAVPLSANMDVEKVGRTTGLTRGKVISQVHGAHPVRYSAALYNFSGDVYFEPVFAIVGVTDAFSDSGNCGSLITTTDNNGQRLAVGIVVGGMNSVSVPGGKITIALPIQPILAELGVTLVSGHNT